MTEKKEEPQMMLFAIEEPWKKEWIGMPEFIQEDLMPWKTLYVHFEDEDDMNSFSEFVGQKINDTTKYMWFPEVEKIKSSMFCYTERNRLIKKKGVEIADTVNNYGMKLTNATKI